MCEIWSLILVIHYENRNPKHISFNQIKYRLKTP